MRRGPLGAVGGGVPALGMDTSGRVNLASLAPFSDAVACECTEPEGLAPISDGFACVKDILGEAGTLDTLGWKELDKLRPSRGGGCVK